MKPFTPVCVVKLHTTAYTTNGKLMYVKQLSTLKRMSKNEFGSKWFDAFTQDIEEDHHQVCLDIEIDTLADGLYYCGYKDVTYDIESGLVDGYTLALEPYPTD